MAKPIRPDPVLRGRTAREFERRFLVNTAVDMKKAERSKKDIELYQATKSVR